MVFDDRSFAIERIAKSIGISSGSVDTVLTEIVRTNNLKRVNISRTLMSGFPANPKDFNRRSQSQDETWFHHTKHE